MLRYLILESYFKIMQKKYTYIIGFGQNWDNVSDIKMEKTDIGFQAEITLNNADSLNFCFNDGKEAWDNNDNQNYTFAIEELPTALLVQEEEVNLEPRRRLSKTYIWSKKIKLAVYKIITYLPKLISGNYKRKINNNS